MKPDTAGNTPEPHKGLFARKVSVERALEAARRLINSHFNKPDKARCSIPANADDDDIVLTDYLRQSRVAAPSQEAAPPTGQVQQWNGNLQSNGTVYEDAVLIEIQRGEIRKQQCEFEYIRKQIGPEKWAEIFSDQQKIYAGLSAEPAPSPATKDTPAYVNLEPIGTITCRPTDPPVAGKLSPVSQGPAREETPTFEKWLDNQWGKTLAPNSTYAANLREAFDARAQSRTATQPEVNLCPDGCQRELACGDRSECEEFHKRRASSTAKPNLESRTVAPQPDKSLVTSEYCMWCARGTQGLCARHYSCIDIAKLRESLAGAAALPATPDLYGPLGTCDTLSTNHVGLHASKLEPNALEPFDWCLNWRASVPAASSPTKRKTDDEYLLESRWWEERQGAWPKDWLAVRKLAIEFAKEQTEPLYNYIDILLRAAASSPEPNHGDENG